MNYYDLSNPSIHDIYYEKKEEYFVPVCQQIALVMNDLSKMRIHIVIILNVILVVRR